MKVTLLIPTLNEIEGMRIIMPRVNREWVDQIIVIDGGSTDGTVEYARENGYTVVSQVSRHLDYSFYYDAMPIVEGDIVITFSPDGNSLPSAIPQLIEKMKEGYDMVVGSRYLGTAHSDDDDFLTSIGNRVLTQFINILFGGKYTDCLVMLRAWKKDLGQLIVKGPEFEPHLSAIAAKLNCRVTEIPASEPKRIGGERKLRPFYHGFRILKVLIRERLSGLGRTAYKPKPIGV